MMFHSCYIVDVNPYYFLTTTSCDSANNIIQHARIVVALKHVTGWMHTCDLQVTKCLICFCLEVLSFPF